MGWDGMGCDAMRCNGMGWDAMRCNAMEWDGMGLAAELNTALNTCMEAGMRFSLTPLQAEGNGS